MCVPPGNQIICDDGGFTDELLGRYRNRFAPSGTSDYAIIAHKLFILYKKLPATVESFVRLSG
jgi:hypothetical protein